MIKVLSKSLMFRLCDSKYTTIGLTVRSANNPIMQLANYVSPTGGRHIVFGSVVVGVICVVVVCVIPCEHNNFRGILNFIFKLDPGIDHIKFSDEFENFQIDSFGILPLHLNCSLII